MQNIIIIQYFRIIIKDSDITIRLPRILLVGEIIMNLIGYENGFESIIIILFFIIY